MGWTSEGGVLRVSDGGILGYDSGSELRSRSTLCTGNGRNYV